LVSTLEGALSLYGILTFLLVFGLLGYLLHNSANLGVVATLFFALVVGIASAVLVSALLTRIFLQSQTLEMSPEASRLEGRLGTVSMAIHDGGIGEVIFKGPTGARQSVGARSVGGRPIPSGAEVVILSYRDGIANVQPWDQFMASVRAGEAPQLEALGPFEPSEPHP
jgi:membrane protein implicated in regulation of membrane protease activity